MDLRIPSLSLGVIALSLFFLSLLFLGSGCIQSANIDFTIPAHGETGVAASTNIQVGFTTPMDPEGIIDTNNFVVRGSSSGTHGTSASYDQDERILTITISSPFAEGELVTVTLTDRITSSIAIPLDTFVFSFTIAGASADPEDFLPQPGEFLVESADPPPASNGQSRRPRIRVTFEQRILESSVQGTSGSVTVRGEESGLKEGTITFGDKDPITQSSRELIFNLDGAESSFAPGETVWVSLTDAIEGLPADGSGPNLTLRPFVFEFAVRNGHVTGGFNEPVPLSLAMGVGFSEPIAAAFGDYLPNSGLELALLDRTGGLSLLRKGISGTWVVEGTFNGFDGQPLSMRRADLDDSGIPDLVVLTDTMHIELIEVQGQGLARKQEPLSLAGSSPHGLEIADLDGNGLLDLAVAHDGGVSFIQQVETLDISQIPPVFARSFSAVGTSPLVDAVTALGLGDLDEDGRVDLVAAMASGISVMRSAGNFQFLTVSTLGGFPAADLLRIADVDGDGDLDVVAGSPGGLLFYANPATGIPEPLWSGSFISLEGDPTDIHIGNIDGDPAGLSDLVAYDPAAPQPIALYIRSSLALADYVPVHLGLAPSPSFGRIALGDANDDRGQDLLIFGAVSGGQASVFLAETAGVVDTDDVDFAFTLPLQVSGDLGDTEHAVTVSASLGGSIEGFSIGLDFDETALSLVRIEADSSTFGPGMVTLTDHIDNDEGSGVVTADINGLLAAASNVPLVRYVFTTSQTGSFSYQLKNGLLDGSGGAVTNQVVLAGTSTVLTADISGAAGTLQISSSVPAVTDLTCEAFLDGAEENINLTWVNGSPTYDNEAGIRIRRNGGLLITLPGYFTSFTDLNPPGGSTTYDVIGVENGIPAEPTTCSLTLVPAPTILTCERDANNSNLVRLGWTGPAYDSILIRRNGNLIATVAGTETAYADPVDENGHLYEIVGVQGGFTSSPAQCVIIDTPSGALVTALPFNLVLTITNYNDAFMSWINGESYASVEIRRNGVDVASLDGSTTSYSDTDLTPGSYVYEVQGTAAGLPSGFVATPSRDAQLPPPHDLSCTALGGNSVHLSWTNGPEPENFSYDSLIVTRDDGESPMEITLAGDATSYEDTGLPDGNFTYFVTGIYQGLEASSALCSAAIHNLIRVDDLTTTLGIADNQVQVTAQVLDTLSGFSFELDYDGAAFQLQVVDVPFGTGNEVTVTDAPIEEGPLRRLTVTAVDVSVGAGQGVLLATVTGTIPADFAAVGQSALHLGSGSFTYEQDGSTVQPNLSDGVLTVSGYALELDDLEAVPGGELIVWAYGTFHQAILGYTTVITYDPSVLTCLEVSNQGTVGQDLGDGFFWGFDNTVGVAQGTIISLFLEEIPASIHTELIYFRFHVSASAAPGSVSDLIFGEWILDESNSLESVFASVDGQSIFPLTLDGRLTVAGMPLPPTLDSIDPSRGPVDGGTVVSLTGSGFTADMQVAFGGTAAPSITLVDASTAQAVTPAGAEGIVDVTVTTLLGEDTLAAAFQYEALRFDSLDPAIGAGCDPIAVTITGGGMMPDLEVLFGALQATDVQVNASGSSALVTTPVPAEGASTVDVTLTNPGSGDAVTEPGAFTFAIAFLRGDVNADGAIGLDDVISLAGALAGSGPLPSNLDAADVNDDGVVHIGDVVYLSGFLFGNGEAPPAPYPAPGVDPTEDGIGGCN